MRANLWEATQKAVAPFAHPHHQPGSGYAAGCEALAQLERELASARQQRCSVVKLIHGYGSSGVGGDIRIAVQKRLRELQDQGSIRGCIFGEDWSTSDAQTWSLLQRQPALKTDQHLGKHNSGSTIVVL